MLDTLPAEDDLNVALTETARLAVSVNSKHREVQRLGRTAKEIAAEIGEELIKVKQKLAHGEFKPWVGEHCGFSYKSAARYMQIAKIKSLTHETFARADSINEVLDYKPSKATPQPERRAATLDDLRKVERLRALRDDPSASEGERANAQAKIDAIEKEIGKVEPESPKTKDRAVVNDTAEKVATILFTRDLSKTSPIIRNSIINALVETYGDSPKRISRLLRELERTTQ